MYCKKCGKNIPEDSAFCPHCGAEKDSNAFVKHNNNSDNSDNTGMYQSSDALDKSNDYKMESNYSNIKFSFNKIQLGIIALSIPYRLFVQKDKAWWVWPFVWAGLFFCYNNGVNCYRNGKKLLAFVYLLIAIVWFGIAAGIMQIIRTGYYPF